MTRPRSQIPFVPPHSVMVWSITDELIENETVRVAQFMDIIEAGFGGVMAFVRCSRYSWADPEARRALAHIEKICSMNGVQCWVVPDPRLVSHELRRGRIGLELLLFGNSSRASVVPNTVPLEEGKFSVRCDLPPRHVHTLTEVAVEFTPIGLERVFAVRPGDGALARRDVVDITSHARMFYNARDRYVEAFGSWRPAGREEWRILAFFHVSTNHVDFSDFTQLRRYEQMLAGLKRARSRLHGVAWDEPGFTCVYGSLPYSRTIKKRYATIRGGHPSADLWKMAFDAEDGSHIPVRVAYYRSVGDSLREAERRFYIASRRLWGPDVLVGIHDTWHFESADMSDMTHGSLDLWESAGTKSGGFVDLGGVQALADPDSPYYANLAALSVLASSLGKLSPGLFAYNNLWTVGDDAGTGSQWAALEHCARIMGLFGTRWLAHAYGPAGTIGQERTFLGSPPLPGYPHHSTWKGFSRWNTMLKGQLDLAENRLPEANLLVIFPVETMYALGDARANDAAASIFRLILALLDNHYHVDLIGSTRAAEGRWRQGKFTLGGRGYHIIIYPFPSVVGGALYATLREEKDRVLYMYGAPAITAEGVRLRPGRTDMALKDQEIFDRLAGEESLRPVRAPAGTWVTMTRHSGGILVAVAPSRVSHAAAGVVSFNDASVSIPPSQAVRRILFVPGEGPRLLDEAPARGAEE